MSIAIIEGLRISYKHCRQQGTGPGRRVIYVHGTGCNARVFDRHMQTVSARHEVVAIDLPGHGDSEGTGFRGVGDYAYFVAGLIESLGWDRCVVAGHSLGGGIALAVAAYFPQLIEGMMLIDTGARLRVAPAVLEAARKVASGEQTPLVNPWLGFAVDTPPTIVDVVNRLTAECDPAVAYKDWVADDSFDFMSRLHHIRVPTLAVCGGEDQFTPLKYHEHLRDHLPDCRLEIIEKAGHWPFIEQVEAFDRRVLEFLEDLSTD